jgi:hypothetical protein
MSDLIQHFALQTEFLSANSTKHISYKIDPRHRRREKKRFEEVWTRERRIGEGGFSEIWLEKKQQRNGEQQLRAVKVLPKSCPIDYNRELFAMAKLTKVCIFSH